MVREGEFIILTEQEEVSQKENCVCTCKKKYIDVFEDLCVFMLCLYASPWMIVCFFSNGHDSYLFQCAIN